VEGMIPFTLFSLCAATKNSLADSVNTGQMLHHYHCLLS
jgi:hypothetical protein